MWCARAGKPLPDSQIADALIWKAVEHVSKEGRISFVLPHGVLFNHSPAAVRFQRRWVEEHTIERVLNLADLRLFLFSETIHPALVVNYRAPAGEVKRLGFAKLLARPRHYAQDPEALAAFEKTCPPV